MISNSGSSCLSLTRAGISGWSCHTWLMFSRILLPILLSKGSLMPSHDPRPLLSAVTYSLLSPISLEWTAWKENYSSRTLKVPYMELRAHYLSPLPPSHMWSSESTFISCCSCYSVPLQQPLFLADLWPCQPCFAFVLSSLPAWNTLSQVSIKHLHVFVQIYCSHWIFPVYHYNPTSSFFPTHLWPLTFCIPL